MVVRHEEEASVDKGWRGIGFLRARRRAETVKVRGSCRSTTSGSSRSGIPVAEGDSGEVETLSDGSLSIPLYEEELVVTKRTVLRERVIVRKQIAARTERVEAELRREQVEIEADDEVEVIDEQRGEEERDGDR